MVLITMIQGPHSRGTELHGIVVPCLSFTWEMKSSELVFLLLTVVRKQTYGIYRLYHAIRYVGYNFLFFLITQDDH